MVKRCTGLMGWQGSRVYHGGHAQGIIAWGLIGVVHEGVAVDGVAESGNHR